MLNDASQILTRYLDLLASGWIVVVVGGAACGLAVSKMKHRAAALLLLTALLAGAYRIYSQASLFDDAFVTFRYVDNWVRGLGPVFNDGEYVEGYTNPLWMLLVLIGHRATGLEIPLVALGWNLAAYVGVLAAAVYAGTVHQGHRHVPVAACLLAVQQSVTAYATTGMETLLGSALVLLAFGQMRSDRDRGWGTAGLLLALAVVHRLDHALFWGAGLLAALSCAAHAAPRDVLRRTVLYLAPLALVLGHLGLKYAFYGDVLPNTYYAKATDQWRIDQGVTYFLTFAASSGVVLVLPLVARFALAGPVASLPARVFVGIATLLWPVYILKVGGDFMFSRFWLPLFPLVLVAAEAGAASWRGWARAAAYAGLGSTLWGLPIIPDRGAHHWKQANESRIYPLIGLSPVEVRHPSWHEGRFFREVLYERDIEIQMGSCCIGMVGFYSRQPLMDFHGLTDRQTARKPLKHRSLPGHEKRATPKEIRERGVKLARWGRRDPPHLADMARLRFPAGSGVRRNDYSLVVWDQPTVDLLRDKAPEIRIKPFPRLLDDYIEAMEADEYPRDRVERDLRWFRSFYFDHNDDLRRLRKIERWLRDARPKTGNPK